MRCNIANGKKACPNYNSVAINKCNLKLPEETVLKCSHRKRMNRMQKAFNTHNKIDFFEQWYKEMKLWEI